MRNLERRIAKLEIQTPGLVTIEPHDIVFVGTDHRVTGCLRWEKSSRTWTNVILDSGETAPSLRSCSYR